MRVVSRSLIWTVPLNPEGFGGGGAGSVRDFPLCPSRPYPAVVPPLPSSPLASEWRPGSFSQANPSPSPRTPTHTLTPTLPSFPCRSHDEQDGTSPSAPPPRTLDHSRFRCRLAHSGGFHTTEIQAVSQSQRMARNEAVPSPDQRIFNPPHRDGGRQAAAKEGRC